MESELNFDFNFDFEFNKLDICGLVKKMKSKQRKMITVRLETLQLENLIENPPKTNECFKLLSVGGGFSSIALINYIAEKEKILDLHVSTFRIGKKQFETLLKLHHNNKLLNANFITSSMQQRSDSKAKYDGTNREYDYFAFIKSECVKNNWKIKVFDNHSKLILMRTPENYYVIETSSNMNENPKMEQFNWENEKQLYDWYLELFKELMK